jgi:hypothetical protein
MELVCNLKPGEHSPSSWVAFDTAPVQGMVSLVGYGLRKRWRADGRRDRN